MASYVEASYFENTHMTSLMDHQSSEPPAARNIGQSIKRGLFSRCPNCGEGKLFKSYLRPVSNCSNCSEDFTPQRADDLPAYLTVVIVGHIVIAMFMAVENVGGLSLWAHLALWVPITILLSLGMLQPIKGATIGLQWANRMHGFG